MDYDQPHNFFLGLKIYISTVHRCRVKRETCHLKGDGFYLMGGIMRLLFTLFIISLRQLLLMAFSHGAILLLNTVSGV